MFLCTIIRVISRQAGGQVVVKHQRGKFSQYTPVCAWKYIKFTSVQRVLSGTALLWSVINKYSHVTQVEAGFTSSIRQYIHHGMCCVYTTASTIAPAPLVIDVFSGNNVGQHQRWEREKELVHYYIFNVYLGRKRAWTVKRVGERGEITLARAYSRHLYSHTSKSTYI